MPFSGPSSAAAFSSALTSATLVSRLTTKTQSVMDAFVSGTRIARPLSLPLSSGKMSAMALAEPVDVGQRFDMPERARRRSVFFTLGASSSICVLVTLCTVVIEPCSMPSARWMTCTTGARQLVVHDAAVTMSCAAASYAPSLTPTTMLSTSSSLTGADTTTLAAPPAARKGASAARVRNAPVHSATRRAPAARNAAAAPAAASSREKGTRTGARAPPGAVSTSAPPSTATSTGHVPCTVSYLSRYATDSAEATSFSATSARSARSKARRITRRPMRPQPLTATGVGGIARAGILGDSSERRGWMRGRDESSRPQALMSATSLPAVISPVNRQQHATVRRPALSPNLSSFPSPDNPKSSYQFRKVGGGGGVVSAATAEVLSR